MLNVEKKAPCGNSDLGRGKNQSKPQRVGRNSLSVRHSKKVYVATLDVNLLSQSV